MTGKGAKLLTGVGQPLTPEEEAAATASGKDPRELRPALTAVQLGKGIVIRVGLPEWLAAPRRPVREPGHAQHRRHPARRPTQDPVDAMSDTAAFGDGVLVAGMVLAAALAAGAVLARTVRGRAWAMLGALVLTPVLLVAEIWNSPQIESVRDRGALALGGGASWGWRRWARSRGCSRAARACSASPRWRRCRSACPCSRAGAPRTCSSRSTS